MNNALSADRQALVYENLELIRNFTTGDQERVNDSDWNYIDAGNDWYAVCTLGNMQSPIVIDKENVIRIGIVGGRYYPFKFHYRNTEKSGVFSEKSFEIEYVQGKVEYFTTDGQVRNFETVRIEVHAPAEHIVKGKQKALELHIIHKDSDGNTLIFAVLFKISAAHNTFIQDLIDEEPVDLNSLIGENPEIYLYSGSLTYPPCTEHVLWVISASTQRLSYEQVKFFSSKWENNQAFARGNGNNRVVQGLNNRAIFLFS